MSDHWSASYIGIPYKARGRTRDGLDCWGLLRLVYADRLGITLPAYTDAPDAAERAETGALITREAASWWTRVQDPVPMDAVLFRVAGWPTHVGVVVAPGRMLHVARDDAAKVESWQVPLWSRRLHGFYRYTVTP